LDEAHTVTARVFKAVLERIIRSPETRKDAVLCFAANQRKKVLQRSNFHSEAVRKDENIRWKMNQYFFTEETSKGSI